MSDPQQYDQAAARKLELLQQWMEAQLGKGTVATLSMVTANQLVGGGMLPAARIKQLVDQAVAQGVLTPPSFFFAALLDLCQQLGGTVVVPLSADSGALIHSSHVATAVSGLLRRHLQPSVN